MISLLGVLFLFLGLVSTVGRISLFSSIRRRYPVAYKKIGSPSVYFINFNPVIPLSVIEVDVGGEDFSSYKRIRFAIIVAEMLLAAFIVVFAYLIFLDWI